MVILEILALIIVIGYFSTLIVEKWLKYKEPKTDKAHVTKDLYKVQMKWLHKGNLDFAEVISGAIEVINQKPTTLAVTNYGREVQDKLQDA